MAEPISNVRPISILVTYMVTALALTLCCIHIIWRRGARVGSGGSRRPLAGTFIALATVSLASTWYYMLRYFQWSYWDWAYTRSLEDSAALQLGLWLRDTSLFRQAWASTLETPARTWWSLQIFGFCAIWSIELAVQAKRRGIPHPWVFMLLGQIVAISFAANVSFIAFIVYDNFLPSKPSNDATQSRIDTAQKGRREVKSTSSSLVNLWWPLILGINLACAICVPDSFGSERFMPLLLLPHLLSFVPMAVTHFVNIRTASELPSPPSLWLQFGSVLGLLIFATVRVINSGGSLQSIPSALYEHPAVSSVGWDVLCCWISFSAWSLFK
ncbi:hypothetical protein BGZ63DRAFT_101299 [Mariannaea sp. PMI_226]|nr:hypothetical protein BGZ63DRAFT_101299 [Mariannaea sp. PMI_226]